MNKNDNNVNRIYAEKYSVGSNNRRISTTRGGDRKVQFIVTRPAQTVRPYPIRGTVSVPHTCMQYPKNCSLNCFYIFWCLFAIHYYVRWSQPTIIIILLWFFLRMAMKSIGPGMMFLVNMKGHLIHYWQDTEDSKEQCVLNDSTGLSWGLNSINLKCSYEFRKNNLSLEWWREHWNFSMKQCQ